MGETDCEVILEFIRQADTGDTEIYMRKDVWNRICYYCGSSAIGGKLFGRPVKVIPGMKNEVMIFAPHEMKLYVMRNGKELGAYIEDYSMFLLG